MFPFFIFIWPDKLPDIGNISYSLTKTEVISLVISFILGWLSVYLYAGYTEGFDAWGIKMISFLCGNILALVYWIVILEVIIPLGRKLFLKFSKRAY